MTDRRFATLRAALAFLQLPPRAPELQLKRETMMKAARRVALVAVLLLLVSAASASAQRDIEILSKEDAAQVFGLSKAQWRENLVAVEKAGMGTGTGDALTLKAPKGVVTTLPIYSRTDARPSRLEVTVEMEREDVARFDDATVADMMQYMRRQMEPEYVATGRAERIHGGGMRFFFTVSEKRR